MTTRTTHIIRICVCLLHVQAVNECLSCTFRQTFIHIKVGGCLEKLFNGLDTERTGILISFELRSILLHTCVLQNDYNNKEMRRRVKKKVIYDVILNFLCRTKFSIVHKFQNVFVCRTGGTNMNVI